MDTKLEITRYKRWKPGLWRDHLDEIEPLWSRTLEEWIEPDRVPHFDDTVREVGERLRGLHLD